MTGWIAVAFTSNFINPSLEGVFTNNLGQRAELVTPDDPNAIQGLLRELGNRRFSQPPTPDELSGLCGRVFSIRSSWTHGGNPKPTVVVAGLKSVPRIQA